MYEMKTRKQCENVKEVGSSDEHTETMHESEAPIGFKEPHSEFQLMVLCLDIISILILSVFRGKALINPLYI